MKLKKSPSRVLMIVLAAAVVLTGAGITIQKIIQHHDQTAQTPPASPEQPKADVPKPHDPNDDALVTVTPPRHATPTTTQNQAPPAGSNWPQLLAVDAPNNSSQEISHVDRVATQVTLSGNPLADGKAKLEAGDYLGARAILTPAIASGQLSEADLTSAKELDAKANQALVFSPKKFANDTLATTYVVQSGDAMQKIANKYDSTADFLCRINGITDARRLRSGQTIKVIPGPFHAVVTKSKFTMDLFLGGPGTRDSTYICTFPVGLGKDDSTPTGTWIVEPHRKLKNPKYYSPRGEGVIEAGDPKNPLGNFWIGLEGTDGSALGKQSYGIHGTIEPESIGKQSSLGCIRMRNEDVTIVYEMLIEGKSTVIVKD